MPRAELAPRLRDFCEEYLKNGGDAFQAALAAGYTDRYAKSKSYRLAARQEVQDYLAGRRQEMARRAVAPEQVLLELARIGFADVADYVTVEQGKLQVTDLERMDPAARRAIVAVKSGNSGVEVKLADKLKALELMGKNLGLFERGARKEDTGEVKIVDDIPE